MTRQPLFDAYVPHRRCQALGLFQAHVNHGPAALAKGKYVPCTLPTWPSAEGLLAEGYEGRVRHLAGPHSGTTARRDKRWYPLNVVLDVRLRLGRRLECHLSILGRIRRMQRAARGATSVLELLSQSTFATPKEEVCSTAGRESHLTITTLGLVVGSPDGCCRRHACELPSCQVDMCIWFESPRAWELEMELGSSR